MSGVLTAPPPQQTPPPGLLATPAQPQGVMPPAPGDASTYPDAATIQALMTTPERNFAAYAKAHPVQTRLSMLAAAASGGPAGAEAMRQTLAARQSEPLALAQQLAQFGGIQGLYRQLGDAGRTDLQNLLLVDPASALKAVTQLITLTLTPQGQTLQAPGLGGPGSPPVSMTANQYNAPTKEIPYGTVQGPGGLTNQGPVPALVTTTPTTKIGFIEGPPAAPPQTAPVIGLNGQPTGANLPAPPATAAANAIPSSQEGGPASARETTLDADHTQARFPGQPYGTTAKQNLDGTTTLIPPPIGENDFVKMGQDYQSNTQHQEAVARAQALGAVGNIIQRLPPGALSSQAALNTFVGSLTSHDNPTRPSSVEDLLKRMGLSEAAYGAVSGLFPAGQQITPQNVRDMYRSIYSETAPRVQDDVGLLAPIVSTAQKYHYNATPYVGMHPQLPDVPSFARDALPDPKSRKVGQVVWGAKGPAKWNGQKWTLIGQ